jgi:hypothetical protein
VPFPSDWVQYKDGSYGPPTGRVGPWRKPIPIGPPRPQGNIEAIPTSYLGVDYRSRAEARWAIVLTNLGIKFQYEPQVFDTPEGRYLPDFLLPTQGCWIEVKGPHPSLRERTKARAVARASGLPVHIFSCGVPTILPTGVPSYACGTPPTHHSWRYEVDGTERMGFMFGVKECCGAIAVVYNALVDLIVCDCKRQQHRYDPGYLYALQVAMQRGRMARF